MNFVTKKALPRRAFLRGAGSALIGLPVLDSMMPALSALSTTPANPVRRLGFVYIRNGVCQGPWWPKSGPSLWNWRLLALQVSYGTLRLFSAEDAIYA